MPFAESEYIYECAERDRLLDLIDEATTHCSRAVGDLAARMGTLEEPAYSIAKASVERAREHAEQTRTAVLKHREEHGC